MKSILVIVFTALLSIVICGQDFNGTIFKRIANTNSVRPQSNSSTYVSIFSMQQKSLGKSQTFQTRINSQQNDDVLNYRVEPPSRFYAPPKINYSVCEQLSFKPYSTPRPNSQQYSSTCIPQSFRSSTSYNHQLNQHSSTFLPLNIPKSSTHLPLQPPLFSSKNVRVLPDRAVSRFGKTLIEKIGYGDIQGYKGEGSVDEIQTSKQLAGYTGVNEDILLGYSYHIPNAKLIAEPKILFGSSTSNQFSEKNSGRSLQASEFSRSSKKLSQLSGPSGSSELSELLKPSRPLRVSGSARIPETKSISSTGIGPSIRSSIITRAFSPTIQNGETQTDDDFNHPPHIHSINVECNKTMMTINIEFNRVFDGIIYTKGYYSNPKCIYVKQNSGSARYSFTVNLDSCGTQFFNDFVGPTGQAYLENVLVLQNEPSIQEVWDTVRRVQCLWEGNINQTLRMNLSVDMLNQEIITFNGDTVITKLDIQIGRGPFAPTANGLIKIGETMTLVISVEGDPDFDLQVRNCSARDEISTNMLQLTDERGCTLKPKLFGAFQKTKDTANTGAFIIAYAFFRAFKFPDVLGLLIECNVELCKTNCEPCPEANQQIEPGRRRRSLMYAPPSNNLTNSVLLSDVVHVGRRFKVIMVDDLNTATNQILDSMEETAVEAMAKAKKVCMNNNRFYIIFSYTLRTLFIVILNAVVLYIKLQRIRKSKFIDS
ncbi:PREDICTED: LOW QUALITY PROTEIN: uncharacterized protein LOC108751254 [Trachymyrmex septentrionalis]|uniref:LOW QUALITY PROTEIN: uncharacterized protein LOC108751254 n=1 Tax=Trachymyrmex septentrionalis TaxID=34720 RepID=UPI00084F417A|nr:PREDICTED: LOW QUALITY PROTEIN: uncharacterized protein LOC108751254 [Trachymyrmex septentrionalis]